ncbi:MAG TPA: DNA methyltransferase [Chloroflexota bacterium]|nr:DNA methyltransferase [Chloroflexota bacterium]
MDQDVISIFGGAARRRELGIEHFANPAAVAKVVAEPQRGIPAIARDRALSNTVESNLAGIPTTHTLMLGDARKLDELPDESVHLVVTSPPYWTLKEYEPNDGQLGHVSDYDEFNRALACVWEHCYRLLVPGGRLVINVGDVSLPRRKVGRHLTFPLHASIIEHCRSLGFDNLSPIIWNKIANAKYEAGGGSILGKPYEPNGIVKNDIEWILFQRKPGGYRSPEAATRAMSVIPSHRHQEWFKSVWTFGGASTRQHPAPYPEELPSRLIRMFSFVGDVVLDPFSGTGTTSVAASRWGRDSIGIEVEPKYHQMALSRLLNITQRLI